MQYFYGMNRTEAVAREYWFELLFALLAVPGALCSFYLYPIYDNIGWHHPELFPAVALVDQCRFVGFTLVVVGFVATLEWNALFIASGIRSEASKRTDLAFRSSSADCRASGSG